MGWKDCHLHQFTIRGLEKLADTDPYDDEDEDDDDVDALDERNYNLKQCITGELFKFTYEYDFGDGWEHQIVTEKIVPRAEDQEYPICIDGKRACPVEDSGGMRGFTGWWKRSGIHATRSIWTHVSG
jgi:Plasmid pRiA4b ORF-3-like protein